MARAHVGEDVCHGVRLHLPRLEVEPREMGLSIRGHVCEDVTARAATALARLRARARPPEPAIELSGEAAAPHRRWASEAVVAPRVRVEWPGDILLRVLLPALATLLLVLAATARRGVVLAIAGRRAAVAVAATDVAVDIQREVEFAYVAPSIVEVSLVFIVIIFIVIFIVIVIFVIVALVMALSALRAGGRRLMVISASPIVRWDTLESGRLELRSTPTGASVALALGLALALRGGSLLLLPFAFGRQRLFIVGRGLRGCLGSRFARCYSRALSALIGVICIYDRATVRAS